MEVILTKVSKLGNVGDVVNVKGGYARNYLIPTGSAVTTTVRNVAYFEKMRTKLEAAAKDELAVAQQVADKISALELIVYAKVSEGDAIFGSVSVVDILQEINATIPEVSRHQISLVGGAVRELGEYDVVVSCHRDIKVTMKLTVADIASK